VEKGRRKVGGKEGGKVKSRAMQTAKGRLSRQANPRKKERTGETYTKGGRMGEEKKTK